VRFHELTHRIHPKSHIGELRGLLPQKYSPLRANGDGLQSVYLAEVGRPFAAALSPKLSLEVEAPIRSARDISPNTSGRRMF
jgi:putative restriction endonuclease